MIYIGEYKELIPEKNYPSMKGFISETPYPGKAKVISYLLNGQEKMISMDIPKDVFTGENIPMDPVGMDDGEYSWFTTLAYYVDKYNLRLPSEFENKILQS